MASSEAPSPGGGFLASDPAMVQAIRLGLGAFALVQIVQTYLFLFVIPGTPPTPGPALIVTLRLGYLIAAVPTAYALLRRAGDGAPSAHGLGIRAAGLLGLGLGYGGSIIVATRLARGFWPPPGEVMINHLGDFILYGGVIWLGARAVLLYRHYRDQRLEAALLEGRLARAQLNSLKMQIQPHFLFNTLNAIATLTRDEPAAAERMMLALADLLHRALEHGRRRDVRLADEVETAALYMEIQKIRFGDWLSFSVSVEPAAGEARVPSFVLQPLIENAIKHGLAPAQGHGHVSVEARLAGRRLVVEVSDDGVGPREGRRGGVGLRNIRERLRHMYGEDASVELVSRNGGGATTRLDIPYAWRPVRHDKGQREEPALTANLTA